MNLTRKRLIELSSQIQTALDSLGLEDVKLTVGNGTYGETGSFKLAVAPIGNDGVAVTKESAAWARYAPMHSCPAEWLGMSFKVDGGKKTHTIIGWRSRASKKPVLTSCDGKEYVWPSNAIHARMTAQISIDA
jgi:hypothetical protein